jgi:hypothetical protein
MQEDHGKNLHQKITILESETEYKDKIVSCIERNKASIWGWKDPRSCLTIDLFHKHLDNPKYIICYRNSQKIAESLFKRERIDFETGINLANYYKNEITEFINAKSSILEIHYECLLESPKEQIKKIIDFLNISLEPKVLSGLDKIIINPKKVHKLMKWEKVKTNIKKIVIRIMKTLKIYNIYRNIFRD